MIETKKTVVIADDEPIVRLDIKAMLSSLGFVVVGEAKDGFDALEICKAKKPDIALLDIKMPVFDGLSAASKILENDLADCVVLLTAYSDSEFVAKANEVGVTGYLVKPIDERLIKPTLEVAYATAKKIAKSKNDAKVASEKLDAKNLIDRAKAIIAKQQNISESEAYRFIQQIAMGKRLSMKELAQIIIENKI